MTRAGGAHEPGRRSGLLRPALIAMALVGVAGVGYAARGLLAGPEPRRLLPPLVGERGHAGGAPIPTAAPALVADTTFPVEPVELLWLQGRLAQRAGPGLRSVFDGSGRLIVVDRDLRFTQPRLQLGGRDIESAARHGAGWWIASSGGDIVQTDSSGRIARTVPAPYEFTSLVASWPHAEAVWATRSPRNFNFRWDSVPTPVISRLSATGEPVQAIAPAVIPQHVLMTELANTGHLEVLGGGDTLFYAPFIRDELIALTPTGDTLWVATRGLPQSTAEPRLVLEDGVATMEYYPVNLGLTAGPDGRLYLLSTPGYTTVQSRLDVFDPATGALVWTARFPTALPTLAVNARGRLYRFDAFRLLSGVAVADRELFAPFSLDVLGGGHIGSAALAGRVTLINFWASWCTPCRVEMPALDSLRRAIAHPDFQFLTMNEDENPADAEWFMQEFGFEFPALLGRGDLKTKYFYRGLPFTVLVDREGKVVQRWMGYAGEEQMDAIRTVIDAELARGDREHGGGDPAMSGHRH